MAVSALHAPRRIRTPVPRPARPGHQPVPIGGWRDRFVELYGRLILLAAWWSVFRICTHHLYRLDRVDDVFALVNLPVGPSLFSAVLLFIVAGAVRRRMRMAWWVLFGFQVVSGAYLVAEVLDGVWEPADTDRIGPLVAVGLAINATVTVLLVVLLSKCRTAFPSRLEHGARRRALLIAGGGIALSIVTSIVLTLLAPHRLRGLSHELQWAVREAIGVGPDRSDVGWVGQDGHHWVAAIAGLISGVSLIVAALVFLRSARAKAYLSAQDELAIRGLLSRAGERDSLGYFGTRRDKSVAFAPVGDAAITFRVVADVSLASADPIGPSAGWPAAIAAWLAETRQYGWFPAVLAASEQGARAYVAAGLKALPIGDEAVLDTETFTLEGPAMQPIRRAARRIRRAGYTITVCRHGDLSAAQMDEVRGCADDWRVDKTERGFSMALGRLGDPLDARSVAVLAHDRDGQLRGLLSLVPWGQRGLSLDLMRRDRTSENGLNEAMVATLVREAAQQFGVRQISLNFAMFRGVFSAAERIGARPTVRLASRIMRFASRFWQIESLYRTNARYLPQWQTRYLCYDSPLTLARVSYAAAAAEGFLPSFGGRPPAHLDEQSVVYDGTTMPLATAVRAQDAALRNTADPAVRQTEQQRVRLRKLELLRCAGRDPYPVAVPRDHAIGAVRTGERVSVVGRVRAIRNFGGLVFLVLQEGRDRVQAMMSRDELGTVSFTLLRKCIDLGDLVSVTGPVVLSAHGEPSVRAHSWTMAAKCTTPVPKLGPSGSARQSRSLELIVDPTASELLRLRSAAVRELRNALVRRDFLEVETPMLHAVHGGASARPFRTHMNAYDIPLYLRIAPELHLKRLCVGGMGRIFEVNRNFPNEGVDDTHNPEFTSLEVYQAFADYRTMQRLARELILGIAGAVHGAPVVVRRLPGGRVAEVDLSAPWPVVPVHQAVSSACGMRVTPDTGVAELARLCREHAIPVGADPTSGGLVVALYERLVEACTAEPTFYIDFPVETSPLTRAHRDDPRLAERWDLVAYGQEIGTAYSELTDPVEQRRRLAEQSFRRAAGDPEAMEVDEEFLDALGYAMPPTGGLGIGVDRLVMMLTGAPIRDTLAFPFPQRRASRTARW